MDLNIKFVTTVFVFVKQKKHSETLAMLQISEMIMFATEEQLWVPPQQKKRALSILHNIPDSIRT